MSVEATLLMQFTPTCAQAAYAPLYLHNTQVMPAAPPVGHTSWYSSEVYAGVCAKEREHLASEMPQPHRRPRCRARS